MVKYKCGKFTVEMLHYGNKLVFLRDGSGEEFTVQRDFFDENYNIDIEWQQKEKELIYLKFWSETNSLDHENKFWVNLKRWLSKPFP